MLNNLNITMQFNELIAKLKSLSQHQLQFFVSRNPNSQLQAYSEGFDEAAKQYEDIIPDEVQNQQPTIPPLIMKCPVVSQSQIQYSKEDYNHWRVDFYALIPKMFKRQKWNQYMELSALKVSIAVEFGEVDEQFRWMQKEEQVGRQLVPAKLSDKKEYLLRNSQNKQLVMLTLVEEDFSKLLPSRDLNDALIDSYLRIMRAFILPEKTNNSSHIYSTYLVQKLTGQIVKNAELGQVDIFSQSLGPSVRAQVREKYHLVERWNKKIDIFDKQILIFPINMLIHWFCVLVINPGSLTKVDQSKKCQIIFCDSMFQSRLFVVEAIREYLKLQLERKRNIFIQVTQANAPSFQLLLPRQTNNHDCGLYMLAYIQQLLLNRHLHLDKLEQVHNRNKLLHFPNKYMHSLRQRMMRLFIQLYQKQSDFQKTDAVFRRYLLERQGIYELADKPKDYSTLDMEEFRKFLIFVKLQGKVELTQEQHYSYLVKFNLSNEANYYEKDNPVEDTDFSEDEDSEYK